jgi:cob(I)alamin adenosyltransferase
MTGLIHLYTGDGKGKTTAAIGLAVRATGRGRRVMIIQFLKGRDSGELHSLTLLPRVTIGRLSRDYGFVPAMGPDERSEVRQEHDTLLHQAAQAVRTCRCDLLVLDEIAAALRHHLIDETQLLHLIDQRPSHVEIVLTGRDAPASLTERADYITDMQKTKHPFDQGVPARRGIEW